MRLQCCDGLYLPDERAFTIHPHGYSIWKKNLYSTISMAPGDWGANAMNSEICEANPTEPFIGCLYFESVENSICQGICCIITVVGFFTGNRRRTLSTEAGSL